jgi:hypothetical protein
MRQSGFSESSPTTFSERSLSLVWFHSSFVTHDTHFRETSVCQSKANQNTNTLHPNRSTATMRFSSFVVGLLFTATPALATFHKDVVSSSRKASSKKFAFVNKERDMKNTILSKAMPLADYQAKMGLEPTARRLEDGGGDQTMYSFSGYSIKYAKCQPVQYFSEDAVAAGMRSPMVTNDIVILRLCPQSSCSQSREYGCVYNYAEYALSMSDYLEIMMEYSQQKKEYTCDYCDACINQERRLEDGGNDGGGDNSNDGEENDGNDGNDQDNDADAGDDGNDGANENDGYAENYDYSANNSCGDNWNTYCSEYAYMCAENGDDQNNGGYNEYDYETYEAYMECAQVNYNDYAYFMKPTCNAYTGVIEFGIYFDDYCSESAASKVSLNKLGLGLSDSIFQEFYSGQCIDCSESVSEQCPSIITLSYFLQNLTLSNNFLSTGCWPLL